MLEINSRGTTFIFGVFQDSAWILEKRRKKELKQGCATLQHLPMLQRGTCCLTLLKLCFSFLVLFFLTLYLSIQWGLGVGPVSKVGASM
jgi:hypothetical protein